MSFREKSAWLLVGIVVVAYGWYVTSVMAQIDDVAVADVAYQRSAVAATMVVVVLVAVSHVALAAIGPADQRHPDSTAAIRRYARSTGGIVITAAAVLGMALAMAEADYFWIANVILAGLVVAELSAAGFEIVIYRRGT